MDNKKKQYSEVVFLYTYKFIFLNQTSKNLHYGLNRELCILLLQLGFWQFPIIKQYLFKTENKT